MCTVCMRIAEVADSAGLTERKPTVVKPRPLNVPTLQGYSEPVVRPAGVADCGKPAIQHSGQHWPGPGGAEAGRGFVHLVDARAQSVSVNVCIDQSGHESPAAAIHQLAVVWIGRTT